MIVRRVVAQDGLDELHLGGTRGSGRRSGGAGRGLWSRGGELGGWGIFEAQKGIFGVEEGNVVGQGENLGVKEKELGGWGTIEVQKGVLGLKEDSFRVK